MAVAAKATDPAPPAGARLRVLRSVDEVDALRSALASDGRGVADANLALFRAVLGTRPEVVRPHVIVLERDGRVDALLLARLEQSVMPATFGYATLYRPTVRCLAVASDSVAGADADQDLLVRELLRSLEGGDADVVLLQHVAVESALHTVATRVAPRFSQQPFLPRTPHWVLDLPDSADELHRQLPKSVRDNLRRYSRRLARDHGDRLEFRTYSAPEDYDAIMRDVEAVAATSYQRGLGAGFDAHSDGPFVRATLADGLFRAWVLYLDGAPCAFETGYVGSGTVVIAAKGFDPAYGRLHVGKALQLHILEELSNDPGVRTLDFGFGDAEYKEKLSNRGWTDVDVAIYSRTRRGLTVNACRTAIIGADRLARRVADKVAGKDRIARLKRRWRDRRTPDAS